MRGFSLAGVRRRRARRTCCILVIVKVLTGAGINREKHYDDTMQPVKGEVSKLKQAEQGSHTTHLLKEREIMHWQLHR